MPELQKMIGQTIVASVPAIDRIKLQKLILHGVESGGLWVESQTMTNALLARVGVASATKDSDLLFALSSDFFLDRILERPFPFRKSFWRRRVTFSESLRISNRLATLSRLLIFARLSLLCQIHIRPLNPAFSDVW